MDEPKDAAVQHIADAPRPMGQCRIQCQIRRSEGSGGDGELRGISKLLISHILPFESLSLRQLIPTLPQRLRCKRLVSGARSSARC